MQFLGGTGRPHRLRSMLCYGKVKRKPLATANIYTPTLRLTTSTREPTRDQTTRILSSPYARIAIGEFTQVRMGISSTNNSRRK